MIVADDSAVDWLAERLGFRPNPARGLAIRYNGRIVGAVAYWRFQYEWEELTDLEGSMVFTRPASFTRGVAQAILSYPFDQLQSERMTARVAVDNPRSDRLVRWLGFTHEGTVRRGRFPDHRIYGLLRSEYQHGWNSRQP